MKQQYISDRAKEKEWIRDITSPYKNRIAVIGGNGSAKTTYSFRLFGRLAWRKPGMFLVTSGTTDQIGKLFDQKLKDTIRQMGLKREDNVRQIYKLANGTEIHMKSNKTFESAEGIEYDYWFADEFQSHTQEAAEMYRKRTRRSRDDSIMRITGLPEDPDSWMYEFLDNNKFKLHEISLYAHPDPEWITYYEKVLKELYTGAKRDRYLYGKRVSLSGMNLFNVGQKHLGEVPYDKDKDVYFNWDFNVIYCAVTMWQEVGLDDSGVPVWGCVASYRMDEDTTYQNGIKLAREWAHHKGRVFLDGDASGDNRSASTSDTMWEQVQGAFKEVFGDRVRDLVRSKNPPVKDTIEVVNWALTRGNVIFDADRAARAYRSLSAVEADKYGEIDKRMDESESGAFTHEADTCRYELFRVFEQYLPGRGKGASIEKIRGL